MLGKHGYVSSKRDAGFPVLGTKPVHSCYWCQQISSWRPSVMDVDIQAAVSICAGDSLVQAGKRC